MIFLFVFLFAVSDAKPGYSGSLYSGNNLSQGTTGGGTGAGGYGYAGSYSGAGGFPSGNVPNFVPFIPQFDFSSFFEQLNRQHQEFIQHGGGAFSYSYASSNPGGNAQAQSSIIFDNYPNNGIQKLAEGQAHAGSATGPGSYAPGYQGSYQGSQGGTGGHSGSGASAGGSAGGYGGGFDLGNRGGFVGGYGGGFSSPDGNSYSFSGPIGGGGSGSGTGGGAAFASGSIGPGGSHQTASVYPENPSAPNVNTRFGGESSGGDGGAGGSGFKSVFTSSKSVSSNINGKPQNFREASTTINDNGKVTTYTAHNP